MNIGGGVKIFTLDLKVKLLAHRVIRYFLFFVIAFLIACSKNEKKIETSFPIDDLPQIEYSPIRYVFINDINMGQYLDSIEGIAEHYDSLLNYPITEHIIVHNNKWIIDSLVATDYYIKKKQGVTVKDPLKLTIFKKGDALIIPDSLKALSVQNQINKFRIDVNIPEFKLRIFEEDSMIYAFPARVGRNTRIYLAMAGRVVDLKTKTGNGSIININKNPTYINPSNNRIYKVTKRDDGVVTKLPQIPWLEPEINGQRHGQWIHPTTNPNTLDKAYSNGCIGISEQNMWILYYHSKVGTNVSFRYNLEIIAPDGQIKILQDIYNQQSKSLTFNSLTSVSNIKKDATYSFCSCL